MVKKVLLYLACLPDYIGYVQDEPVDPLTSYISDSLSVMGLVVVFFRD
jgi:hypothetical protein